MVGGTKDVSAGFLQIKSNNEWNLLCNNQDSWDDIQGSVACRQLGTLLFSDCMKCSKYNKKLYFVGYENGALFTQIGQSAKIRLPRTEGVPIKDLPLDFQCRGDESNLAQCNVTYGSRECNINYNSVFLVCNKPPIALCPEGQTPFDGYCYEMNTIPENFTTAQSSCKAKGGALLEITR